jgi:hypothetical protein
MGFLHGASFGAQIGFSPRFHLRTTDRQSCRCRRHRTQLVRALALAFMINGARWKSVLVGNSEPAAQIVPDAHPHRRAHDVETVREVPAGWSETRFIHSDEIQAPNASTASQGARDGVSTYRAKSGWPPAACCPRPQHQYDWLVPIFRPMRPAGLAAPRPQVRGAVPSPVRSRGDQSRR